MAIQIKHKRKHIEIIHQKTSTVSSPALPKAGDGSDASEKDSKAMSEKNSQLEMNLLCGRINSRNFMLKFGEILPGVFLLCSHEIDSRS